MAEKLEKIYDLLNEADYILYNLTNEENDFRAIDEARDNTLRALRIIGNVFVSLAKRARP